MLKLVKAREESGAGLTALEAVRSGRWRAWAVMCNDELALSAEKDGRNYVKIDKPSTWPEHPDEEFLVGAGFRVLKVTEWPFERRMP